MLLQRSRYWHNLCRWNSGLNNTVNNALKVCTLIERTDLKIYSGAINHYIMIYLQLNMSWQNRTNKKGDPIIVNADFKVQGNAIDFIIETCKSSLIKFTCVLQAHY